MPFLQRVRSLVRMLVFAGSIVVLLAGCKDTENQAMRSKLKKQRAELTQLQDELSKRDSEITTLRRQIGDSNRQLKQIKYDFATAKNIQSDSEKACLKQNGELKNKLKTLESEKRSQENTQGSMEICRSEATAIIHYHRKDKDYNGWGVHIWGDAAVDPTSWSDPRLFSARDPFGAVAKIPLRVDSLDKDLWFIIHRDSKKSVPKDLHFVPKESPEVWMIDGDPTIYTNLAEAQGKLENQ